MSEISSMGKMSTVARTPLSAARLVNSTICIALRMVSFMWARGSITVTDACAARRKILMISPSGSPLSATRTAWSGNVVLNVRLNVSRS